MQSDSPEIEAAFVFADLSGFTALTEVHGNLDAANVAAQYAEIATRALQPGARLVKTIGDEVMIVAQDGLTAIQTAIALYEAVNREPRFPTVRIGIHAGPVVARNGDYFGAAVNVAARVAARAQAGQILCTKSITASVPDQSPLKFRGIGLVALKNIAEPVPLFEIFRGPQTDETALLDPVCRMHLKPEAAPARIPFGGQTYYFCSFDCAKAFTEHPDLYARTAGPTA